MHGSPLRFLIFRNGSIGNTIVAIPAIRAIRESFPDARLVVVVDNTGKEILERCDWINDLIVYDKRNKDRGVFGFLKLAWKLRKVRSTHAVLFKRFYRNGLLARLSGARVRAGYMTKGEAPFLNLTIPYDESVHVTELNLRLATAIGAHTAHDELELFLAAEDEHVAARRLDEMGIESMYIVCHYGGQTSSPSHVSLEQFVELLLHTNIQKLPVVLVGSGNEERRVAEEIARSYENAYVATDLSIRVTAALIKRALWFIGFDSGPSHICAAVGTPGIAIFAGSNHAELQITRWRPKSNRMEVIVAPCTQDDNSWLEFYTACSHTLRNLVERDAF